MECSNYTLARARLRFSSQDQATDSEGVGFLVSLLMLAGVRNIRGVFDYLNRLRFNAEERVEKRRKAEAELTLALRFAQETAARLRESEERLRFLGDNLPGAMLYQIDCGVDGCGRHFTRVSSGVEKIHEMSVPEVMERPYAIYTQLDEADSQPPHVEVVLQVVEAVLDRVLRQVDAQRLHGVLDCGREEAEEPGVAFPVLLGLKHACRGRSLHELVQ